MQDAQKLFTYEMKLRRKNNINKMVLGSFLFIAIGALLLRIIVGAFLDAGYVGGKFHIGFWTNPQEAFEDEYKAWLVNHSNGTFSQFLDANDSIKAIIVRHPNTIWFATQFTWLTTIIMIMYVTFRFFRFDDTIPRWLKWIMSQRTLSLVTMYDTIVGVIFWASMFNGFERQFSESLFVEELIITILVHAIIPSFILTYSIIFLIKDRRASQLNEMFAVKGLIWPGIYLAYYIVVTIVWYDPYPITNMHDNLIQHGSIDPDWGAWAKQLYLAPIAIVSIYIFLGVMTLLHNVILHKFNKKYDPEKDYEIIKRKENKLEKISRKLIRKEARDWRNLK